MWQLITKTTVSTRPITSSCSGFTCSAQNDYNVVNLKLHLPNQNAEGDENGGGCQTTLQHPAVQFNTYSTHCMQYTDSIMVMLMVYSPGLSLLQPKQRMANSVMLAVMMMVKPKAE